MKVEFNKKYTTIAIYVLLVFAVCFLTIAFALNFSIIAGYIKKIFKVLAPITWGIVIAFIINPVMKFIEKQLKKILNKKKPRPKLVRSISVFFSMLILIAAITLLISIIIPQVVDSMIGIFNNFPLYLNNLENWVYQFLENYPDIANTVNQQFDNIQPTIISYVNDLIPKLGDFAVRLKDSAILLLVALKDFIIGFIVAVYLLFSKETFIAQSKKAIYAVFPKKISISLMSTFTHSNKTLSGFISGKLLDSLIIGILCFISMRIMNLEFVTLISVIVGVTNIIPFFGPFIGAIPSALLLLVSAPKQVIPFVIFIIILQQFDGNILGPKILGDSTGLSPFWVMFAIFIGGGLFGFAGMLLGVPVFAVIYGLVSDLLAFILKKKRMSSDTRDYIVYENDVPIDDKKQKPGAPPKDKTVTEFKTENVSAIESDKTD